MTFTVMARCPESGRFGMCTTSFSPIAGSRVSGFEPAQGALAIMSFAAPALVLFGQRLLRQGLSADAVLDALLRNDPYPEHRQIGILDARGGVAARTGSAAVPFAEHRCGANFIVLGNVVASQAVIDAMYASFIAVTEPSLPQRLLKAVEAGRDAGGQLDGQRSAFLRLSDPGREHLLLDLRVDFADEPVGELRGVFEGVLARDPALGEEIIGV